MNVFVVKCLWDESHRNTYTKSFPFFHRCNRRDVRMPSIVEGRFLLPRSLFWIYGNDCFGHGNVMLLFLKQWTGRLMSFFWRWRSPKPCPKMLSLPTMYIMSHVWVLIRTRKMGGRYDMGEKFQWSLLRYPSEVELWFTTFLYSQYIFSFIQKWPV